MLLIDFKYRYIHDKNWIKLDITSEDYFDLDPDEGLDIWSIPKSDNLIDYIEKDRLDVESIIIIITDTSKNESLTFKQQLWNKQRNSMLESIENKQGIIDVELILQTLVQDDPDEEIWETIRFSRKDGMLTPTMHSFTTENRTGLISDKIIIPELS